MTNLVNIKRNLSSEISKLGAKTRKAIIYFETHMSGARISTQEFSRMAQTSSTHTHFCCKNL